MSKRIEITGEKFNRWTVLEYRYNKNNHSFYLAQCDCGTQRIVSSAYLRRGTSKSCGCFLKDVKAKEKFDNRFINQLKDIHHSMMQRCYWEKSVSYKNYGGRGITVCDEWHNANNFVDFALNNGWLPNLQTDRINNDGNYEPSNVRFVTRSENMRNSRVMTAWTTKNRNAKGQWAGK